MKTCPVCDGFGRIDIERCNHECTNCDGRGFIAPVGQSRRMSLVEICTSTAIGFVVAFVTTHFVMPWFGHNVSYSDNFWITCIFTVVSLVRSYCVRRLFEAWR
jgi:hypothetical protein